MKRFTLNAVVVLLVAYAALGIYAALSALWIPPGSIGLLADYGGYVRAVWPDGPAAIAGVVAGDHIRLGSVPRAERRYVAGVGVSPPIGTRVHFALDHHGQIRTVMLTSVAKALTPADRTSILVPCAASLIFMSVGAALMMLRLNVATWGFGLYCLLVLPTAAEPLQLPSIGTTLLAIGAYDIIENFGIIGLLLFALEFPRRFGVPWRNSVRRAIPLLLITLCALTLFPDIANLLLGRGDRFENHVLQLVFGATYVLAFAILCDTYRRIAHDERERLRWVLLGFGIGLSANFVGNTLLFSSLIPIVPPVWLLNLLISLNVLLPVTVAHAVVRHRVLDINFVVSRALIYAALTTLIAGVFGLFDWVFGHLLEDFRLSRLVEAAASIVIAFAFDALHKRMESLVETVFFQRRRAAEVRLERLARDLLQARTVAVVEEAVVGEICQTLELTSAALFWSVDGAQFQRTAAHGWGEADCGSLDDSDLLMLALRGNVRYIRLVELPWRRENIPRGTDAPVIALPIRSRADLAGILLYGAHPAGGDVDPNEIDLIEGVAHAAGIALDELEAERLRAANVVQLTRIAELESRVDELRRIHGAQELPAPAFEGS